MFSKMIVMTLFGLLFGPVIIAEQAEDAATTHHLSNQNRELRTIFCRCVADFETFYDRRRQLKSYFLNGGLPEPTTAKSLREKTSKYYNQGYSGKTPRQSSSDVVEGPDGFVIVDGITVLPLDDEACVVSQTNSALRTFLEGMFRPRGRSRSKGMPSFSSLFQNRRALMPNAFEQRDDERVENEHDMDERVLQGWGDRRNMQPTMSGRGGTGMSLRDKKVQSILDEDLREYVPENEGSAKQRPQPSPSGYPRVFPCPPAIEADAPTLSPSDAIESIFPSVSPSMTVVPETDKPTVSLQPTAISAQPTISAVPTPFLLEPTISPVPSVAPSTGIEASDMPSGSPSFAPSLVFPPSLSPSVSPAPTVSSVPTNVDTMEPTDSNAPTTSPMPSISPTTSERPSAVTQEPSTSNPPSVLPSISPSLDPTISEFPTISQAPTISPAPNSGVAPTSSPNVQPTFSQAPSISDVPSLAPSDRPAIPLAPNSGVAPTSSPNIEPTFSQTPSISKMPSREPSFSDRPSFVPSFTPSFIPTITSFPASAPQLNITDSLARLRPKNNLCDAAVSLTLDGSPMSGTTEFGTNELDFGCNVVGGIQTNISPGVWFTAVGNGNIYEISTCSDRTNFGTAIQVLTGGCEDLQCLRNAGRIFDRACSNTKTDEWNRFGTRVRVETIPDEVYSFLVLSRLGENTGVFDIHLEEIVTPTNDRCDGAISMVVDVPKLHIGTTASATIGTNYGCGSSSLGFNNNAPGIWYMANGNGQTFSASTCAQWTTFDTAIQVFTGSSCDELSCVAGSSSDGCTQASGSSTVSFPTIPGETYYIYVFGRQASDVGTFILTLTSYDPTAI